MQIKFLGTGSSGNAIVIQTDSTTIMIDCGIPKTLIEKKLLENGVNPADIDAILITHEHGDHIKGLSIADKWNITVCATDGTWKGIGGGREQDGLVTIREDRNGFLFSPDYSAKAFRTHHNTYDSCGYVIEGDDGDWKVSICLDTGHVTPDMIEAMRGSTHIIIESNHDIDMVELSSYPDSVKARNLSDLGHLSNEQTAEALSQLVMGNGEKIYLAHLSEKCNEPYFAIGAVMAAMRKKGFNRDEHYSLGVV